MFLAPSDDPLIGRETEKDSPNTCSCLSFVPAYYTLHTAYYILHTTYYIHIQKVAQKERAWFAREKEANDQALRRMRALCPVGIMSLTVQGLEQQAKEAGSLYPRQLSRKLKVGRALLGVRFVLCVGEMERKFISVFFYGMFFLLCCVSKLIWAKAKAKARL